MSTDGAFNPSALNDAAHADALAASAAASAQTGIVLEATAARTAKLSDANSYVRFTNAGATAFTIPPNSSVAFPLNSVIEFEQGGAGTVTVAAGAGVTILTRAADVTLAGQYAVAAIRKVGTDTWLLTGDL